MGNVGDGTTLSRLVVVQTGGELQGNIKSPTLGRERMVACGDCNVRDFLGRACAQGLQHSCAGIHFPRTVWVRAPSGSSDFGG